MSEPLYCGADGCTLHDYPVAPVFCEFAYQNDRILKVREDEERRFNQILERLIPVVAKDIGNAVFDALDIGNIQEKPFVPNRVTETPPAPPKKTRRGGIST